MNSNFKLLPAALLVAMLALAGCGGGSDDTTDPPTTTPDPTPPPPPPSGNEQVSQSGAALERASDARDAAKKAEDDAESAVKKLGTLAVGGNSRKAGEYAQDVLDAADDVADQIAIVEKAIMDIEAAIAALPMDVPNRANVLESLNDDLMSAQSYLNQIDAVDLSGEVYTVKGALDTGEPSDFSTAVAEAIQSAFTAEPANPGQTTLIARTRLGAPADPRDAADRIAHLSSIDAAQRKLAGSQGMIDRSDNVPASFGVLPGLNDDNQLPVAGQFLTSFVDRRRLSDSATDPTEVPSGHETEDAVLSILDLADATGDLTTGEGASGIHVGHKGLNGLLRCTDTPCGQDGGVLTGNWVLHFPEVTTEAGADGLGYSGAVANDNHRASNPHDLYRLIEGEYRAFPGIFVYYGYWLDGTDAAPNVNTFADPSANAPAFVAASVATTANSGPSRASYSGKTAGIAVVKTYDPNDSANVTSRTSGGFTADVSLEADFTQTDPNLSGEIDNFAGGVADPMWRVVLGEAIIDGTAGTVLGDTVGYRGTAEGPSQADWNATMLGGDTGVRPTTVHGGWGANFPNGEAVGGYYAIEE